ncbi:MAG: GIY-YIG nuclease family protein [Candidatus Pacebacteria bacterium]|nr:GIY-YIG nuclease family protein [Candidatus Paceibacterota bacterium]
MNRINRPIIAVYIMTNSRNGTLYTGVTRDLVRRTYEHRNSLVKGFTSRYKCKKLVWYEVHELVMNAVAREKHIKDFERIWKVNLIETMNPEWRDLYDELF